MNRLQSELHRLYHLPLPAPHDEGTASLVGTQGEVRALVLALGRPATWAALGSVWQGVQTELGLPAPAIAVSGTDACQLWFSLADAVPSERASAFLDALRRRYLGEMAAHRVALWPARPEPGPQTHAGPVLPPSQAGPDRWSAFVAPDLAGLFSDEPWLDMPPGPEAQAELLARLSCIKPEAFAQAESLLAAALAAAVEAPAGTPAAATRMDTPASATEPRGSASMSDDPRQFLRRVMNDPAVDLALRIEAAKALLASDPRA